MTAVLRHAGSASGDTPGSAYGNQQYAVNGLAKLCDCCGQQKRIAKGWTKYGPGKILHRCPECTKAAGVKVLSKLSAG